MRRSKPKFWQDFSFYFGLLFLAFVLMILIGATGYSYRSSLFPLIISIGILPLIILDLLGRIFPEVNRKLAVFKGGGDIFDLSTIEQLRGKDLSEEDVTPKINYHRFLVILLWFIGGLALLYFVGYLPFMFIFVFCFLKFFASRKILPSFAIAAGLSLITWVVFTVFLRIPPLVLG